MASLALSVAHGHEDEERRAADFQAALGSRETIGQAMGILMEQEGSRRKPPSSFCVEPPGTSTSSSERWLGT